MVFCCFVLIIFFTWIHRMANLHPLFSTTSFKNSFIAPTARNYISCECAKQRKLKNCFPFLLHSLDSFRFAQPGVWAVQSHKVLFNTWKKTLFSTSVSLLFYFGYIFYTFIKSILCKDPWTLFDLLEFFVCGNLKRLS